MIIIRKLVRLLPDVANEVPHVQFVWQIADVLRLLLGEVQEIGVLETSGAGQTFPQVLVFPSPGEFVQLG